MWKGNLGQALKTVVSNDMLDANWVAMSVLAGRDVWESMCVLYAKQLEARSQPHMAACYYLACYKPREAVEVYRRAMLFRDAVMLAKTRFAPDDPIIPDLYMAWGQHQEKSGHLVPSACAGHPNEAIQMLASRAGPGYLSLASKVARTCGDPLSHALSIANGMRAQAQGEWNSAKEEFSAHEDLRVYTLILGVERAWVNFNSQLASGTKTPKIEQLTDIEELHLFPKMFLHSSLDKNASNLPYETKLALNFYSGALKFWNQSYEGVLNNRDELSNFYQKLLNLDTSHQLRKEKKEQFIIAHKLTLAILAQIVLDDPSPSFAHFLDAINELYKSSPPIPSPTLFSSAHLRPLLLLVLPLGQTSFASLKETFGNSSKILDSLWAFYKFSTLEDQTARASSIVINDAEVEEYMKTLLVDEHTELQKLKSQEAQLTSSAVETELAIKRHKGSKSAKKGKTGKSTELKTELQRLNAELEQIHKRVEIVETQPKFPDPEKSSQLLAVLCSAQLTPSPHLSQIIEFGVSHTLSPQDKAFWTRFSSHPSSPPSPLPSSSTHSSSSIHPSSSDSSPSAFTPSPSSFPLNPSSPSNPTNNNNSNENNINNNANNLQPNNDLTISTDFSNNNNTNNLQPNSPITADFSNSNTNNLQTNDGSTVGTENFTNNYPPP